MNGVTGGRRPLRIVVTGSSVAMYTRPYRRGIEDGTYAELLETALWERGIPAHLTNQAGWLLTVRDIYRDVQRRIFAHVPDVVIVNVGWVECQPALLPLPVFRWQESWRPGLHSLSRLGRGAIGSPLRWFHRHVAPRLLARLPRSPRRMSPARFEAELRRLVALVRRERQCLVLLLNVNPTTDRVAAALPGVEAAAAQYSAIVDAVASTDDDGVRLIDSRSLALAHGVDQVLPDGIHFNSAGHRLVADLLLGEVERWLNLDAQLPVVASKQSLAGRSDRSDTIGLPKRASAESRSRGRSSAG